MSLRIVVCVKPVPESDEVTIDPVTKTVRRSAGESVISTLDKHALELAKQLKKSCDATVTVLSMAPASAEKCIREALARGGDRAVILSDRAFAGGDTFATSHVLASGIKEIGGADLILTGAASDDGGTGQLAAQLAEWLNIVHLHNISRLDLAGDVLQASGSSDGELCHWKCKLPALVAVNRMINQVGPVGVRDILMAGRKELKVLSADDLTELNRDYIGLKHSPTQNGELFPLDSARSGAVMEGNAEDLSQAILSRLHEMGFSMVGRQTV